MKKSFLLFLVLLLISASFAIPVMANEDERPPVLSLDVKVDQYCETNITYIAKLSPVLTSGNTVPVISFFCDGAVIAKVPINKDGTATYRFWQRPGKYQAVAAWLNTTTPTYSNPVNYIVLM